MFDDRKSVFVSRLERQSDLAAASRVCAEATWRALPMHEVEESATLVLRAVQDALRDRSEVAGPERLEVHALYVVGLAALKETFPPSGRNNRSELLRRIYAGEKPRTICYGKTVRAADFTFDNGRLVVKPHSPYADTKPVTYPYGDGCGVVFVGKAQYCDECRNQETLRKRRADAQGKAAAAGFFPYAGQSDSGEEITLWIGPCKHCGGEAVSRRPDNRTCERHR